RTCPKCGACGMGRGATPEMPGVGAPSTSCRVETTRLRSATRVPGRRVRAGAAVTPRARHILPPAGNRCHAPAGGIRGDALSIDPMRNVELARCFRDLAAYLEMEDVPFKPRAYEKAALAVESYDRPLEEVYRQGGVKALRAIPGIGASMADKLEELIKTGKCALREQYYARMPVDIATLTAIEGVGPKAVK